MNDPATFSDLENIFENLIGAVFALGGLAAFTFLLFGSFKYLTSGGDDKAIQAAKGTITLAIVGLIIMVGAFAFWDTILGDQVLNFKGGLRFDIPK
jgi:hypothetical protein